jgi:hypothetical protein
MVKKTLFLLAVLVLFPTSHAAAQRSKAAARVDCHEQARQSCPNYNYGVGGRTCYIKALNRCKEGRR